MLSVTINGINLRPITRISNHASHLDEKSRCSFSSPKGRLPNGNPRMATATTRDLGTQVSLAGDCPSTRCCWPQLMARAERRPRYSWCLRKYHAMGFPALDMVEGICATWTSGNPVIHYGSPYLFFEVNSASAVTAFFSAGATSTLAIALRPLSRLSSLKLNEFSIPHRKKRICFSLQPEASWQILLSTCNGLK